MSSIKPQLFLFPFAGGSSYSFNPLAEVLSEHFEIVALEMPGHGLRIQEPLTFAMRDVVKDLFKQVITEMDMDSPYYFFGHSLGAVTAYVCTLELEKSGFPLPNHLFISGRDGIITHPEFHLRDFPTENLWSTLIRMGGVPKVIAENEEFRSMYEPILRADLTIIETFTMDGPIKVLIPITTIMGENDKELNMSGIQWDEVAGDTYEKHLLPGGHFYFLDNPQELARIMQDAIQFAF